MIEHELKERVDALLDDDTDPDWTEVVARATAVEEPRTVVRLRPRRVAAVVALAAAVAALAALLPGRIGSGHRHVSFVDEALAAVSQGPVLHAVLEVPSSLTWVGPAKDHPTVDRLDLASGDTTPVVSRMELWFDPDRGLALQVDSVGGTVVWQSLQTPQGDFDDRGQHQGSGSPAQIDPGLAAFLKGYRQSLADGTATDAGAGTIDGRAVEWLRFRSPAPTGAPEEVAVDRDTFQAVAMRAVCPSCTLPPATYAITTLEGVGTDAVDFVPPKVVEPHPVALYDATYEAGTPDAATAYLGRQAYWAGEAVGGLALSGVELDHPVNYSTGVPSPASEIASGKGVTFYYGALKAPRYDAAPGDQYVTIAETADVGLAFHGFNMEELSDDGQPLTVARTIAPPEGQAILTDIGLWSAQLRKGGLYVEIDGTSRDAVVAAAQSLVATP